MREHRRGGRSERLRVPSPAPPRTRGELARGDQVVALVLDVVAQDDVADTHAARQRAEAVRVEQSLLDAAVERVQQVGGGRAAPRDQLARDVGPVHQPGRDRVDGVAPAVRREVGAGQLEHAGVVGAPVEVLPRRRSSTAGCPRGAAGSCRRRCRRRAPGGSRAAATTTIATLQAASTGARGARSVAYTAFDADAEQHRQAEHDERDRAPVLRSASPNVDPLANALNTAPSGVGLAYGCAPTATTTPTSSSTTKNARCRQRTNAGGEQREHDEQRNRR